MSSFVLESSEEGPPDFDYRLFFAVDMSDEWVSPPFDDRSLCFRKAHLPGAKVDAAELRRAKAVLTEPDSDE